MRRISLVLLVNLMICVQLMTGAIAEASEQWYEAESEQMILSGPIEEAVPEIEVFFLVGEEIPLSEGIDDNNTDGEFAVEAPEEIAPLSSGEENAGDIPEEYEYSNGCWHSYGYYEDENYDFIYTGICSKCGYECPHPEGYASVFNRDEKTWVDIGDDSTHIRKYELVRETLCLLCLKTVNREILDSGEVEEAHDFLNQDNLTHWWWDPQQAEDGVATCIDCGYQRKTGCKHLNTYVVHENDTDEWRERTIGDSVGDQGHLVTGYCDEMVFCSDCGAKLETRKMVGPVTDVCMHEFYDGKCAYCGYANTCTHPAEYISYAMVSYRKCVPIDEEYHEITIGGSTLKCSLCGEYWEDSESAPPQFSWTRTLKHDFSPNGVCRECGYKRHTHVPVADAAVAATCTTDGKTEGSHCSVCGEVITAQKVIPATGHTPVTDAGYPATCTADGLTEGSHCAVCGAVLVAQQVIPATGHSPVADYGYAPSCTVDGLTEGSHCAVCGAVLVAQQVIPATGHSPVADAAVAATCTTDGLTEGSHCAVCGAVLVAQQVIPATGHTPVYVPAQAPAYQVPGYTEGSYCAVCGTVLQECLPIPALTYQEVALPNVKNNGAITVNLGEQWLVVPAFAAVNGWTVNGYKSSKPAVASVDGNGLVTASAEGKAKITVSTNEKKKATLTIQVVDPYKPLGIAIAQGKAITVTMGQPLQLNAGLAPETARATLTWTSNKPAVASVDGNGLVTPLSEGKAKITVTTHNKKKAAITVQVVDPYKPTGVGIAQGKAITVSMGQVLQLNAVLAPETARSALTWTSNKPGVASVDASGLVIPQGEGKAKITVTTHNKKKATITVQVVDPYKPLGIGIAQGKAITMKAGESLQLNAGMTPETAQSALTWTSNKPAVASVDGNGVVTALKKGKAKITVMTYNKKKATITVNVVE